MVCSICGKIDEVRIYSYAVSEGEIKALYETNEPPRFNPSNALRPIAGR